jgi:hypothetical protein
MSDRVNASSSGVDGACGAFDDDVLRPDVDARFERRGVRPDGFFDMAFDQ